MRYDADEALRKTLERASALRKRSRRRREIALSAISGSCLCALLALGFAAASQGAVLAGVLAFALGVLVTLACLHRRNGGAPPSGQHDDPGGEDGEERAERFRKR